MFFKTIAILALTISPLFAGIDFVNSSFNEALKTSATKKLPLMLSIHASW
ncbi:hypothetical protein IT568_05830 [bacterium]|nr:hypothetical protein [bacterium]